MSATPRHLVGHVLQYHILLATHVELVLFQPLHFREVLVFSYHVLELKEK